MERERIGLMGGSFNPIHLMHIAMARCAMTEASLNKVLFLPTGNPPHKREGLADASHRMSMVRLAVAEEEGFEPSDIEIGREGIIYTVDTLALLRAQMPKADFYIIGEDTLYELPHWRDPDKVFSMCRFLVIRRQGEVEKSEAQAAQEALIARGAQFAFLSMAAQPTSSTEIRLQLMLGASPKELHPAVVEYIRVMGLYGVSQSPQGAARHMDKLMQSLSIKRMAHTLCVAQTARQLAILHGAEVEKATLAGLYHDCAKGDTLARMQEIAKANHLTDDLLTLQSGALLHSLVGGYLTKEEYGVSDPEVLAAIVCHTLGRTGMTKLDMIVYLADKIEPSRTSYPELEEIRSLALADLPGAVLKSMESTVTYVKSREKALHPTTLKVMAWLREQQNRNDGI